MTGSEAKAAFESLPSGTRSFGCPTSPVRGHASAGSPRPSLGRAGELLPRWTPFWAVTWRRFLGLRSDTRASRPRPSVHRRVVRLRRPRGPRATRRRPSRARNGYLVARAWVLASPPRCTESNSLRLPVADCAAHILLAGGTVLAWLGAGSLLLLPLGASGDRLLDGLEPHRSWRGCLRTGDVRGWLVRLSRGRPTWSSSSSRSVARRYWSVAAPSEAATSRMGMVAARARWLLVLYALLGAVATCAPISSPDALSLSRDGPARFQEAGRIVEDSGQLLSYEPFSVEMSSSTDSLLWDSVQERSRLYLLCSSRSRRWRARLHGSPEGRWRSSLRRSSSPSRSCSGTPPRRSSSPASPAQWRSRPGTFCALCAKNIATR